MRLTRRQRRMVDAIKNGTMHCDEFGPKWGRPDDWLKVHFNGYDWYTFFTLERRGIVECRPDDRLLRVTHA